MLIIVITMATAVVLTPDWVVAVDRPAVTSKVSGFKKLGEAELVQLNATMPQLFADGTKAHIIEMNCVSLSLKWNMSLIESCTWDDVRDECLRILRNNTRIVNSHEITDVALGANSVYSFTGKCSRVIDSSKLRPYDIPHGAIVHIVLIKTRVSSAWSPLATYLHVCGACDSIETQTNPMKICARCNVQRYCGKQCQTNHWRIHKGECSSAK
jgi:hypothetical protein